MVVDTGHLNSQSLGNHAKYLSSHKALLYSVAEISVGWGGGGRPPTFVENDKFSEILTYKRAKNSLFECKWGGLSEI